MPFSFTTSASILTALEPTSPHGANSAIDLFTYLAAWRDGYMFLPSTFLFIGWLVGLGLKFVYSGSQPSLNGSP